MSTKDVAEGYGLNEKSVSAVKQRNLDEFQEGKHFVTTSTERGSGKKLMWTKRGVVRLGFFIKTPMAKEFMAFSTGSQTPIITYLFIVCPLVYYYTDHYTN